MPTPPLPPQNGHQRSVLPQNVTFALILARTTVILIPAAILRLF